MMSHDGAQRHEGRLDDCAWKSVVCVRVCELVDLVRNILSLKKGGGWARKMG
jgi:hypothetical protein